MPNEDERRSRRIECYIVSKARQVEQCETRDLLMIHRFDDIIMNGEKSSFSRMMFDIGRLQELWRLLVEK